MSAIKCSFIRARLWVYRIAAFFLLGSIPLLRKGLGESEKQFRIPHGIQRERVLVDGMSSEWLIPSNAPSDSVLMFIHGGGGVTGLYNVHRWMVGYIALSCGLRVLLPDYRLAPEHPFPSGLDDCICAYRWLLSKGYRPQQIIVAGDSMGGMLT